MISWYKGTFCVSGLYLFQAALSRWRQEDGGSQIIIIITLYTDRVKNIINNYLCHKRYYLIVCVSVFARASAFCVCVCVYVWRAPICVSNTFIIIIIINTPTLWPCIWLTLTFTIMRLTPPFVVQFNQKRLKKPPRNSTVDHFPTFSQHFVIRWVLVDISMKCLRHFDCYPESVPAPPAPFPSPLYAARLFGLPLPCQREK